MNVAEHRWRCDTVLIVGANMPYSEYYPAPGQARMCRGREARVRP